MPQIVKTDHRRPGLLDNVYKIFPQVMGVHRRPNRRWKEQIKFFPASASCRLFLCLALLLPPQRFYRAIPDAQHPAP